MGILLLLIHLILVGSTIKYATSYSKPLTDRFIMNLSVAALLFFTKEIPDIIELIVSVMLLIIQNTNTVKPGLEIKQV